MLGYSALASWLSSVACGVCLVLAVAATPGVVSADPPTGTDAFPLCEDTCSQPDCETLLCHCRDTNVTCLYSLTSRTACKCR